MPPAILITRPNHDDQTAYLHAASEELIAFAKSRDFGVIDLAGKKSNKAEVEERIRTQNPGFLVFNGHGDPRRICGHKNETLVELGKNDALLHHRITYSLACRSAKELGKACGRNPKTAYIGYNEDFIFLSDEHTASTRPLQDKFAEPFLKSSNVVITTLLKGNTAGDAYNRSQKEFQDKINFYATQDAPEAPDLRLFLIWDMLNQTCCGDPTLRI